MFPPQGAEYLQSTKVLTFAYKVDQHNKSKEQNKQNDGHQDHTALGHTRHTVAPLILKIGNLLFEKQLPFQLESLPSQFDSSMQDFGISSVSVMEIPQSSSKPLIWCPNISDKSGHNHYLLMPFSSLAIKITSHHGDIKCLSQCL